MHSGYQNKGLGAVPGDLEPLGCVSFANAVMRVNPRRACFIRALLKLIPMQWGSGAPCWLSLSSLPATASAEGEVVWGTWTRGWALGASQAPVIAQAPWAKPGGGLTGRLVQPWLLCSVASFLRGAPCFPLFFASLAADALVEGEEAGVG